MMPDLTEHGQAKLQLPTWMSGPYSSVSSSCSRQRGSIAVGSWYICTISGRRVPISTSRTLKRNYTEGVVNGRGDKRFKSRRQQCQGM